MISPRNIEAALSKTVQIALIDSYSNIMSPDVHYIPLNKDYSNIDEVIKLKMKNYIIKLHHNAKKNLLVSRN